MTITHGGPATHRPARATKPAGLTWRDQAAMVLVGTSTFVVVAVTSDWNWPLLGSVRSGILGAGLLGLAGCIVGAKLDPGSFRSSFVKTAAALGVAALALIIAGLVTGSEVVLIWLAVVNVGLWILATARHALEA